jgi:hypothetical protein
MERARSRIGIHTFEEEQCVAGDILYYKRRSHHNHITSIHHHSTSDTDTATETGSARLLCCEKIIFLSFQLRLAGD